MQDIYKKKRYDYGHMVYFFTTLPAELGKIASGCKDTIGYKAISPHMSQLTRER